MTLIEDELEILKVSDLLAMDLAIPDYQRPYRWSAKAANTLFMDVYESFKSDIEEYRLGSVILHKMDGYDKKIVYHLVDGQQRTTTLSILLYVLGEKSTSLLKVEYKNPSVNSIIENFNLLQQRVGELPDEEQKKFKNYLQDHCTVVKIVTDNEQEAFQFFDSQNSRGKALKPHDLLKSYHLREMNKEAESVKLQVVSEWEEMNQEELETLFETYLYPSIQWFKGRSGLHYSTQKMQCFKGIKQNNAFNFTIYHKASNYYIEQANSSETVDEINQFQLTQPILAGKRFFYWTSHYASLLGKIKAKIKGLHQPSEIPDKKCGDMYVKQLYETVLMFFADRFGLSAVDERVMMQLYTWSYLIRIEMTAVSRATVNKYARGQHERMRQNIDMFNMIGEMRDPQEVKTIVFEKLDKIDEIANDNKSQYKMICQKLKEWNRW